MIFVCLAAFSTPTVHGESPLEDSLKALRIADIRVASVGERLAMANVRLCSQTLARTGLVLHDIRQYSARGQMAARSAFRFEREISVEGVVPGSPADRAGIRADSALLALDGVAVNSLPVTRSENSFGRMAAILDEEERKAADGLLIVDVLEDGVEHRRKIAAESGCSGRFQIVLEGSRNAFSDGKYAQIDGSMMDFVRNDEELSAVLAHELAHVILDHRQRLYLASNGRKVIRPSRAMIRASENEADRLSLYLMANAGYDPTVAPRFWDRLEKAVGPSIFADGTHAGRKVRVAQMKEELGNLARLREETGPGMPLFPTLARRPFRALP
ncbi:MAG: M48 family metallopeptidase [Sphingobium sp.]|uniref:M48 family metallopeptidase n=1 Tax=Sphingobium sp. CECT 9361 TaxID=2845384 RepID=UPI001E4EE533|nr:M48 family metallopeptidase [Sphingobium sp. CECT 9361]